MQSKLKIGSLGSQPVYVTIDHVFPLTPEWLEANKAEVVE